MEILCLCPCFVPAVEGISIPERGVGHSFARSGRKEIRGSRKVGAGLRFFGTLVGKNIR